MAKRGRKLAPILLETGNDQRLWCYKSLVEALQASADILADLLVTEASHSQQPEDTPTAEAIQEVKANG